MTKTGGRPAVNYELLFDEWVKSGLHRVAFLESYGLDPKSPTVRRKTKSWNRDTQAAQKAMKRTNAYDKGTPRPQQEIAEMWQLVQGWRRGQAGKDFECAEKLRQHLDSLLAQHLKIVDGEMISKLTPTSLGRLADTAAKIQRMQRLALGMSTDNVGIPILPEPETHVEGEQQTSDVPVYVVEVNKDGKFIRSKPRQIS
jgi:hypothetical protein